MSTSPETSEKSVYYERVLPSVGSLLVSVLLLPLMSLVFLPILGTFWSLAVGTVVSLAAALTMIAASPVISVTKAGGLTWLRIARARIETRHLGEIETVPFDQQRLERGPKLDARAFVYFQAGVRPMLKVEIRDPKDPTPYWLFSTRKPEKLKMVLERENV